jgi:hypothetical protein
MRLRGSGEAIKDFDFTIPIYYIAIPFLTLTFILIYRDAVAGSAAKPPGAPQKALT